MNAWGVILRVIEPFAEIIYGVEPEDFFFGIMFKIQVVVKPVLKNVYCIHEFYYNQNIWLSQNASSLRVEEEAI